MEGQGDEKRAAQARLGVLNAEIGRLVEAIAAVGLSEAFRARLREAEAEKMALSRTLNAPARRPLTVAELMGDYEQLLAQLESALTDNVEEARAILRQVLGDVLIEPDEAGVSVNIFTNPAPALAANGGPPIEVAGTRVEPIRLVKLSGPKRRPAVRHDSAAKSPPLQ